MDCIVVRENSSDGYFNHVLRYSYVEDITKSVLDKDSMYKVALGYTDRLWNIKPMSKDRALKIMKIIKKLPHYEDFDIMYISKDKHKTRSVHLFDNVYVNYLRRD